MKNIVRGAKNTLKKNEVLSNQSLQCCNNFKWKFFHHQI